MPSLAAKVLGCHQKARKGRSNQKVPFCDLSCFLWPLLNPPRTPYSVPRYQFTRFLTFIPSHQISADQTTRHSDTNRVSITLDKQFHKTSFPFSCPASQLRKPRNS